MQMASSLLSGVPDYGRYGQISCTIHRVQAFNAFWSRSRWKVFCRNSRCLKTRCRLPCLLCGRPACGEAKVFIRNEDPYPKKAEPPNQFHLGNFAAPQVCSAKRPYSLKTSFVMKA